MALQWGIFWADLNPTVGSEQQGNRPVLIVSAEAINQALPVITVLPLTTRKPGRRIYPTEVLLPASVTGLSQDSIAMAHQIRTIDKKPLTKPTDTIFPEEFRLHVRNALAIFLDLGC